jgi:hypothetical protein
VAVTISLFNTTTRKFADGTFSPSVTYKINLYSAFTFDATATTKTAAESGATQLTTANGYTQNSKTLANVATSTATTNDAIFDADDVTWTASGGSIAATKALIYADSLTNKDPVAFIDFGGTSTATDGTDFKIVWSANGIVSFTYS